MTDDELVQLADKLYEEIAALVKSFEIKTAYEVYGIIDSNRELRIDIVKMNGMQIKGMEE